jgi:hypothetical protein
MIIDLKGIIDDDLIYTYFSQKVEHAMMKASSLKTLPFRNKKLGYEGYDFYCDYLSIIFHLKITPHVSKILNKEIIPTFCFTRMYFEGSKLNFHIDRKACEIAVTHCHQGEPWKLYIEDEDFITQTGTSICYNGVERGHCRISSTPSKALYTIYSWVEKGGKYDKFKYDESEKLERVYKQMKQTALDKSYI